MRPTRLLLVLAAPLLGLACGSDPAAPERAGAEPYVPLPEDEQTIGYFLTLFDDSIAQWSQLMLGSSSQRELETLRVLEGNMQRRANLRRDELLQVLESGAPINRRIAVAALGFTRDPSVLGPVLATLRDPDEELVQRALLSLGVLAAPDTPTADIGRLLVTAQEPWTRSNAAYALLALARAGSKSPDIAQACRLALSDPDAGVRAQCASALGELADPAAVDALAERLTDDENIVALASALSLARIGRENAEKRGACGRVLASSLERVPSDRRPHVLGALRWLRGADLGEEPEPWLEWAHNLP